MELPYLKETRYYDLHFRDIWDVAVQYLSDKHLAPHWEFVPMRLSKWNAERQEWERFIDEPITADALWDAYVCIYTITLPQITEYISCIGQASRRISTWIGTICGQDPPLIIWHSERLPCCPTISTIRL